ncbi:MAG: hypothetical protein HY788_06820 [Deltaproteobacteria bacterium]|nr:hypothetical protein [Deltaproteobacteria bacterium]
MPTTPIILIDIIKAATHYRYSSVDSYDSDEAFYRGVAEFPDVSEAATELLYGYLDHGDVSIRLNDFAGELTDTFFGDTPVDIRGARVTITRADFDTETLTVGQARSWEAGVAWEAGVSWAGAASRTRLTSEQVYRLIGKVDSFSVGKEASLTVTFRDPDLLEGLLGSKTVTVEEFEDAPQESIGRTINIPLGRCRKLPLTLIKEDYVNNEAHYLVGFGTTETNNVNKMSTAVIYRDDVVVGETEMDATVVCYDGSTGSPYEGYASVKFTGNGWQQRDFSGRYYELKADWYGLELGGTEAERNPVTLIEHILSDGTWGRDQSVNAASFEAAAAVSAIDALLCDVPLSAAVKTKEVVDELLSYCRGRLDRNADGEWTIEVDGAYDSTSAATFTQGTAGRQTNIIEVGDRYWPSVREAVKTISFEYAPDGDAKFEFMTESRTVNADFGEGRVERLNYVQDKETADRIACFRQRLLTYAAERIDLTLGQDARSLSVGDAITLYVPARHIDGALYRIERIRKSRSRVEVTASVYSEDIYTYDAGTLPGDGGDSGTTDWSRTPPDDPTDLAIDSTGTYQAGDGNTLAYFVVEAVQGTEDAENFSRMKFGRRVNGEEVYTWQDAEDQGSGLWQARMDGLTPGMEYDLVAVAVNGFGIESETNPTLSAQLAPGDASAPGVPTGLAVTGNVGNCSLDWNDNTEADFARYVVRRGGTEIARVDVSRFVDATGLTMGTAYTYTVSALDLTGNESSPCAGVAGTPRKAGSGDIGDGAVGTTQIANAAITSAKIGSAQITSAHIGSLQVTNAHIANGTIESAKIASLTADKITAGTITADIGISGGNKLTMAAGGDIILTGDPSNPAEIVFTYSGTDKCRIYDSGSSSELVFRPHTDGLRKLSLGTPSYGFGEIYFYVSGVGVPSALFNISGSNVLNVQSGKILAYKDIDPISGGTLDLGDSAYYWSSVFAESFGRDASNYITFDQSVGNVYLRPADHVVMHVEGSAVSNGELSNGDFSFYLSEALNGLYVKVKYSDGTVKTGLAASLT